MSLPSHINDALQKVESVEPAAHHLRLELENAPGIDAQLAEYSAAVADWDRETAATRVGARTGLEAGLANAKRQLLLELQADR